MSYQESYYVTLRVPRDATEENIKKAYMGLALQCNSKANHGASACEEFLKISAAHETLIEKSKRATYDKKLRIKESKLRKEKKTASKEEHVGKEAVEANGNEGRMKAKAIRFFQKDGPQRPESASADRNPSTDKGGKTCLRLRVVSIFPNRPSGPLPRSKKADRAATRFPVIPQLKVELLQPIDNQQWMVDGGRYGDLELLPTAAIL